MKNSNLINLMCVCSLLISGSLPVSAGEEVRLTKAWTLTGFKQPESVVFDAKRSVLYISNVDGNPDDKDGKGGISRATLEGKMLQADWITGLNAPKGLAISGDKLYATDIDKLVEVDLATGKLAQKYAAPQAKFLNDVTVDSAGRVYVSDMMDDTIYRLADGRFEVWLKSAALASPNGLYAEPGRIIEGAWGVMTDGFNTKVPGHLQAISLTDKTITALGKGQPIGNMDGVEGDGRGAYFVTDWMAGKLFHINAEGEATLLLDLGHGSADLTYIKDAQLLIVPMMSNNEIIAFTVE
ncbi:MAG TPA: SMP-30/gluconolactonase/LRE family protein [Gammaproteobacteria bacterium]|nr:SMP-30/gluconolactonase/LRE family protein [Gammaproteobacteria bacterium]